MKRNRYFICTYAVSAGFVCKMSPTIHHCDTLNALIQAAVKAKAPNLKICLTPHTINFGKGPDKTSTTLIEVQVDPTHLEKTRAELMIEIFKSENQLPPELYFVPTPTNGATPYDLYYQHILIHHQHAHDLCIFPITNISNLKAIITVDDPNGTTCKTTFEEVILTLVTPGTPNQKMFYSIKLTTASESEGCYLLVTHKSRRCSMIPFPPIQMTKTFTFTPTATVPMGAVIPMLARSTFQ
jgi:hypothetical protein